MSGSSTNESRGFFAYYRVYARSGVHAASAAALTAFGLVASFTRNRWFILLAIAVYVLPPIFLYLTGEGERVPTVVSDDTDESEADADGETGADRAESTDGADTAPDSAENREGRTTGDTATTTDGPSPERNTMGRGATDRSSEVDSTGDAVEDSSETATDFDTSAESTDADTGSRRDTDAANEPSSGIAGRESSADTDTTDESEVATESAVREVSTDESEPGWTETDTPTDESLLDVASTQNGAYAVGTGGVVLAHDGDEWSVALEDGPTANANPLRGVDATTDGGTVWFAGDSGVLGRYDGRLTDHSAPEDQTSTWEDVAVTGETGAEELHLVNGSGELLRGEYDGGSVSWGDIEKPGSGSSIAAIEFVDRDRGHLCDTNQSVYATTDGGETYEKIGIEDASATFTDVAAADATVVVAGDDGSVFRYDGSVWTPLRVGSTLSAIDLTDETGLTAGDGGAVAELADGGWESVETPVETDLHGVAIGDGADVAVGTDGTAIERHR